MQEHATGRGGQVCVPPTDMTPVGRFAVLTDPAVALFSILQRRDPAAG